MKRSHLRICSVVVGSFTLIANFSRGICAEQPQQPTKDHLAQVGEKVFHEACTQCHGPSEILIQRKSADEWRKTIYSMISRGAFVSANEVDPIVIYLASTFGSEPSGGASSAIDLRAAAPAATILVHACSSCHSVSTVSQVQKSRAGWRETIQRMIDHGAVISASEQDALLSYLVANFQGHSN